MNSSQDVKLPSNFQLILKNCHPTNSLISLARLDLALFIMPYIGVRKCSGIPQTY
ncbi:uncharacterized protein LOC143203476 isoform X2 [Rhynchophorus ferrugineus]|uniref:uncharacterized protein LOC143203476 isoform X2 n=1 Tax=Rhynchophorus ferrugineus TaxID=354439 RepID=UPI003FCCD219